MHYPFNYLLLLKPSKFKLKACKKLRYLGMFVTTFVVTTFPVNGQDTWNLSKCIDYAIEHNLDLTLVNNRVKMQEINLLETKMQILPNLNAGSGLNMSFGRDIDGATNEITYDNTILNDYWVSTSVDLFKGLIQYNTIQFNRFMLAATQEEALLSKNNLIMDIMNAYYTVVYSSGLLDVVQKQANISEKQYMRMQKLMDVGRASSAMVQDLKSQWASDKLNHTVAENNFNKNLLAMKQLLRIDLNELFVLDTTSFKIINGDVQNVDSLYDNAKSMLPQIKIQEYLYEASVKDLAISKGAIMPRLYMSAGFSTRYFDGATFQYVDQLRNNQNKGIGVGISIPIFNGASTYSNIKRKKIEVLNRELDLQIEQERLFSEIQTAVNELQSSEKEYLSSIELQGFSTLSLRGISKKMESGLASSAEFEIAKQRYANSKASVLKTKLMFIMRKQMLEFYKTGNWEHVY